MIEKQTALNYLAAGLAVLPADKALKRPTMAWKNYQEHRPTAAEVETWFSREHDAICLVCGKVSGNLEVIDFDNHGELFDAWQSVIPTELKSKLLIEQTPSGGFHVTYRCTAEVSGNTKLAQGIRNDKTATLIETRGEGGLILCAPSDGYTLTHGAYTALPLLTAEERDVLLNAAKQLNEIKAEEHPASPVIALNDFTMYEPACSNFEKRPGDDFNERINFGEMLTYFGWKLLRILPDRTQYWQRPGKVGDQHSATLKDGIFYVFSTNAAPFEANKGYTPFTAFALLHHNGDFSKAAADLLAQGYGQPKEVAPDVDFSAILKPNPKTPEAEAATEDIAESFKDPGKLPKELLHIPGFVDDYTEFIMSSAPQPNRVLAFCGAITFLSYLLGRKVRDERNNRPNIYLISLANSGVGKNHPRSVNMHIAANHNICGGVAESFASGEGLEDALFINPALLLQVDEIDTLFNTLKNSKESRSEAIIEKMLRIYSSSNSIYKTRKRAIQRDKIKQAATGNDDVIFYPYLTILGTAIPKLFYESLCNRVLTNGLLARCMVIDAGKRGKHQKAGVIEEPESIKRKIDTILGYGNGGNLTFLNPQQDLIPATAEADERLEELNRKYNECYDKYEPRQLVIPMAFWTRAFEKVCKLSIIYAVSADVTNPVITLDAVNWASRFVEYVTEQALFLANAYSYENPFDEKCRKALRYISENGGKYKHGALLKRMHESSEIFGKIIETLIENGSIIAEFTKNASKTACVYRLA